MVSHGKDQEETDQGVWLLKADDDLGPSSSLSREQERLDRVIEASNPL